MSKRDYYKILGIANNSTDADIKKSYRKLASKYHPDKVTDEVEKKVVEEKLKEINEAYDTLGNAQKKAAYDAGLDGSQTFAHTHSRRRPQSWTFDQDDEDGMRSAFEEIFKSNAGTFNRPTPRPTSVIIISLKDAYTGRTVQYDANTLVVIPAGIRSGTKLFVNGRLFKIEIQPDEKFKRSLDDLMVEVTITAIEAMIGIEVVINHLDYSTFQFTIPAGIQSGQIVKLSKKGMKNPESNALGDLLVRVNIQIPKTLTDAERAALKSVSHRDSITI